MKTFYFCLIFLLVLVTQSCKDKNSDSFSPSLNLEEYVMINVDGTERIYTTDNSISVTHDYIGEQDFPYINIFLWPQEGTFTEFNLRIKNPKIGIFNQDDIDLYFLDYSSSNSFPMVNLSCSENSCFGNIELAIHEYGMVGEKLIGSFSGQLTNDPLSSSLQNFSGEFVVDIDE